MNTPLVVRQAVAAIVAPVLAAAVTYAGSAAVVVPPARSGQHQTAANPLRQIQPSWSTAGHAWHPRKVGPHVFYGTITGMNGSVITMHLRNGHTLSVEAASAIASGDYSAPLFVGKLVSVDGDEANGIFTAEHIFRLSNLGNLRADK